MSKFIVQAIGKSRGDKDATKGHLNDGNANPLCGANVNRQKWYVSDDEPDFVCKNCERESKRQ